jgi:hypothetical protein
MLADELDYVVGVDTHLDEHVLSRGRADRRCRCEACVACERARLPGGTHLRRAVRDWRAGVGG